MRPAFIPVGQIVNAHGIRGEVKVNPHGFDPEFLTEFDTRRLAPLIGSSPIPPIKFTRSAASGSISSRRCPAYLSRARTLTPEKCGST